METSGRVPYMKDTDPLFQFSEYTEELARKLPAAMVRPVFDLGTNDLNNLAGTTGLFGQDRTADADTTKGYPVKQAGMLEVWKADTSSYQYTYQRYTTYSASPDSGMRVYIRSNYQGTWSAWKEV